MGTVTGYTKDKMKEIHDKAIISGAVIGSNLHLVQRDGTIIDAGPVRGGQGIQGIQGDVTLSQLNAAIAAETANRNAAISASGKGIAAWVENLTGHALNYTAAGMWLDTLNSAITFTPVPNRFYRISAGTTLVSNVANHRVNFAVCDASGVNIVQDRQWIGYSGAEYTFHVDRIVKAPSNWNVSKLLKLRVYCDVVNLINVPNDGQGQAQFLSVEDLGTGP